MVVKEHVYTENDTINLDLCQESWRTKTSALDEPLKKGCLDNCRSGVDDSGLRA